MNLRQVAMQADPESAWSDSFPFCVNYNLGNVPEAGRLGPSVETDQALRFALRNAIESRQGVFEWARQDSEGLRSQLARCLETSDALSLGQGFFVYDVSDPRMQDGVIHYDMLVSAPARDRVDEEDTFLVPMTEMRVPEGNVVEADWLRHSETALQCHLSAVDPPYQDSVENPFILSSGCNELADMHALRTEVLSRLQAGLVLSHQALVQTFHELAHAFVDGNRSEIADKLLPDLHNQLAELTALQHVTEPSLLAAKRYFPSLEDTESEVGAVVEVDWVSAQESLQESEPEPDSASAVLASPVSAGPSSHTVLTLAGKVPFHQLNEFQAFRQAAVHANHCGIAAVNGFFQAEVINTAKAIDHIQAGYARVYGEEQLINRKLPGLYHPDLLGAMKRGQSIVMTRDQFVGGKGFANHRDFSFIYSANPEDQWDAVCNYKFPGRAKPDRLEITPDLWLSAATGVHLDSLESMVNQFLESRGDNPYWSKYPEKVDKFAVGEDAVRANLEGYINRKIENRKGDQAGNTLFPMICMTSGHYFAVARTESGNWVKLDSFGTNVTGVQESSVFAEKNALEQALRNEGVIHVICEPLTSSEQPVSEAERRRA